MVLSLRAFTCHQEIAEMKQIYMHRMVPPIPAGEHHTWTTRGPAHFEDTIYSSLQMDEHGEIAISPEPTVRGWENKVPDFPDSTNRNLRRRPQARRRGQT